MGGGRKDGVPFRKRKPEVVRGVTCAAVFVVIGIGLVATTGFGTLSSMGINAIATICPLGALESLLGGGVVIARVAIVALVMLVAVFFAGKAFCSFACPVPHVGKLLHSKKRKRLEADERKEAGRIALERYQTGTSVERGSCVDGRHLVLASAVLSAALFGFPVFCLVCPVGLCVATFIAVVQLLQSNVLTWGLVVFPGIIFFEVVVLRKWCRTLCPIGALLSLISQKSRFFRPAVNREKCLRDVEGAACSACASACGEFADPHSDLGERPMSECVKCGKCVASCPVQALTLRFLPDETSSSGRTDVR